MQRVIDAGRGGVVIVVGPAGVGKTAVVDEFARSQERQGRRVLRADEVRRVDRFGWLEQLGRSLDVTASSADRLLDLVEQEGELVDLLTLGLREIAPALVVLEDAHWADDSSRRVLAEVVRGLVGVDVVVVVTSRSRLDVGELEQQAGRRQLVMVEPFEGQELEAMFESAHGRLPSPVELSALQARTAGVALLVEETLTAGNVGSPLVRDVLWESLSRLSADALSTMSLLAVGEPDAPLSVLAAASESSESTVSGHLAEAASIGVLDSKTRWFRHELFAEAARDRLGDDRRRVVHRTLATAWDGLDSTGARSAWHLLAAVPAVEPDDAVAAACGAAAGLRASGRPGDAADLLEVALDDQLSARLTESALTRLLLEVGESRWELGDTAGALVVFERADRVANEVHDVELAARAAVAAQRRHNPFVPDPHSRSRLASIDQALGDGDSPIRVEVLGRRSVLATQPPSDLRSAESLAVDAVAMARRLGDSKLIAGALRDRFLCCRSPAELDARADAAEEILAIARREGSRDWLLIGYEWRVAGCVGSGDLARAWRTITELAATASVMRASQWQLSALLRQAPVLALLGDRDGALRSAAELSELVASAGAPHEVLGTEIGLRSTIAMVYGVLDDGLTELLAEGEAMFDGAPSSFIQIAQAAGSILVGDLDAARRRALPWLAAPETAMEAPSPLSTLSLMSECVAQLSLHDAAAPVFELLEPFRGRNCMDLGTQVDLPVDYRLARLALLLGDHHRAVSHALTAVELGRRMGAPAIEARCLAALADAHADGGNTGAASVARDRAETIAEPIGLNLDPPGRGARAASAPTGRMTPRHVAFTQEADGRCRIEDGALTFEVGPSRGVRQLLRLVTTPSVEVSAVELAGHHEAGAIGADPDVGPVLDARAKRAYRQRIVELNAEIDDADNCNDLERATRSRIELDAVMDELRRATGLGGRDRPHRSGAERARINVTRSLRRAIAAVERHDPDLGSHLQLSIHTGSFCCYRPDPSSSISIHVAH